MHRESSEKPVQAGIADKCKNTAHCKGLLGW